MTSRFVRWAAHRILPRYETDTARLARLEKLRRSLMSEWEGALEIGDGNDAQGVPYSMLVGLVDAVKWAQVVVSPNPPDYAAKRLRESIDRYLQDLDTMKWRRTYK